MTLIMFNMTKRNDNIKSTKALVYRYEVNGNVYYAEGFEEDTVRKALSEKLGVKLNRGGSPSRQELTSIWAKEIELTLTKRDVTKENKIQKQEMYHRILFWIERLQTQDSRLNNKHSDYCGKVKTHTQARMFEDGELIPNTGFVVAKTEALAQRKKLYMFEDFNAVYHSLQKLLDENNLGQTAYYKNNDLTLQDLLDAAYLPKYV